MKPQTKVTLYVGLSNPDVQPDEIIDTTHEFLQEVDEAPSGATIEQGKGLWKDQREKNLRIEFWTDGRKEIDWLAVLKNHLEGVHDRSCVCFEIQGISNGPDVVLHEQEKIETYLRQHVPAENKEPTSRADMDQPTATGGV